MEATLITATIDPEKIREELSELWVKLAKDDGHGVEGGVLRACSMTLIACVEERDDPSQTQETLAMLMREHPSRAIVIRVRESSEEFLESRVFAQCWMPFGHGRQICCEEVEITASDASLRDLPGVLLALIVPDLPVMLWSRSARIFDLPAFPALAAIAQKVIIDSAGNPDVLKRVAGKCLIGDLAWTRVTRWRELIAQIFENRCYVEDLSAITRARLIYRSEVPSTADRYMGAWVAMGLEKAGAKPALAFERGEARAVILEIAGVIHTSVRRVDESSVEVIVRGRKSHVAFPRYNDYSLLREELSITGRDPVFESVLARVLTDSA